MGSSNFGSNYLTQFVGCDKVTWGTLTKVHMITCTKSFWLGMPLWAKLICCPDTSKARCPKLQLQQLVLSLQPELYRLRLVALSRLKFGTLQVRNGTERSLVLTIGVQSVLCLCMTSQSKTPFRTA